MMHSSKAQLLNLVAFAVVCSAAVINQHHLPLSDTLDHVNPTRLPFAISSFSASSKSYGFLDGEIPSSSVVMDISYGLTISIMLLLVPTILVNVEGLWTVVRLAERRRRAESKDC